MPRGGLLRLYVVDGVLQIQLLHLVEVLHLLHLSLRPRLLDLVQLSQRVRAHVLLEEVAIALQVADGRLQLVDLVAEVLDFGAHGVQEVRLDEVHCLLDTAIDAIVA